ncbi:anthocyanidin reductase ((2S)-flavan-3-ol-forming)-like isoform X3 [Syzygium oleosum]|uniref:anthocyanidin reductase ((2S)-flavan-3-ol-forming)-like isoform X3 n=1 Tax=Syzygium oleosum TaxID=219896 RepID=UPI0024B9AC93|nr:anthocyanidin reductase ((2S)-flavan-3-ol-forming)-like isoform X3 [Syzygium oleosum]
MPLLETQVMREKWGSSRVFLMQRRGWCYLKQICTIPMILRKQFEGVNMFFMWPPHCTMTPAALRVNVTCLLILPSHQPTSIQFKDTSEAAVAGVKSIAESCIRSGTVRRLIYTATVMAASPMKDDAKCFAEAMDESCWTPLNLSDPHSSDQFEDYVKSKTQSERELLRYDGVIEIVSIALGLVGGSTIRSALPDSLRVLIAQATNDGTWYRVLRILEEVTGKVPVVHIEDACEAHIFCISKQRSISGRFLCASDYVKTADIAHHIKKSFPEIQIPEEFIEDTGREIAWGSSKLEEMGFKYKYDLKMILEDSINCARMAGEINSNT